MAENLLLPSGNVITEETLNMTLREIFELVNTNIPKGSQTYFLELSKFGINLYSGMESKNYHCPERSVVKRNEDAIKLLKTTKEEEEAEKEYAPLTDIQKERKELVIGKTKLSPAQLERIRILEVTQRYIQYVYAFDRTDNVLLTKGIALSRRLQIHYKIENPLCYMTNEGFSVWQDETDFEGWAK